MEKSYVCRELSKRTAKFHVSMRFKQAHDKVSKKYEFLPSFNLSAKNTLLCSIYFNLVLI
jgi:hypothetical protein